jgi:PcaR/PcaU/PobR family beta-ketoadipate pathway transcriptional regulator
MRNGHVRPAPATEPMTVPASAPPPASTDASSLVLEQDHAAGPVHGPLDERRASSLFVGSFEKGLRVLAVFDREQPQMGLREISQATGLDQSSVQRFTFTLLALGFLHKDERTRKYSLTARVLELGFAYLQTNSLIESATPLLYEANKQCGESLNLSELIGTEVVYVARAPGRHVISVDILLGTRMPAYAAAPGRAMLAHLPREEAEAILGGSDLRALTAHTVTSRTALLALLDRVRRDGYALAEEQCFAGDISAAAPIFGPGGRPIAALNVSVPSPRWTGAEVRERLVPLIVETAARMSQRYGGAHATPWFARTIRGSVPPGRSP